MQGLENTGRAWVQVSLENIKWNYRKLMEKTPEGCKCMAIVKADGYGHGAAQTARILMEEGCDTFAVAALEEGIALRAAGIEGMILVLGYTMPRDAFLLERYDLHQTIVDETHARALAATERNIKCHLAVDTGMNRLGIRCQDKEAIDRVLALKGILVDGIFSHMCVADSDSREDHDFTLSQIKRFEELRQYLLAEGHKSLEFHMQSSYGMLNYPMEGMAYVRPGIVLFGCYSNYAGEDLGVELRPALELKSRVGCVRRVAPGEFVSYGRTYEAETERLIAVATIGYADGLPRALSGKGFAMIRGKKVPIVGRVCMDQTMIDVTDVEGVVEGDVVTFIGRDGSQEILAVEVAEAAGTITNELLSRLGDRLNRVYGEKN